MRRHLLAGLAAISIALSEQRHVAADDYDWTKDSPACTDLSEAAAASNACTRMIDSGELSKDMLTYVYVYRGRAFSRLQDWKAAHRDLALAVDRKLPDPDLRETAEYDLQVVRVELGQVQEARAGFWTIASDPDAGSAASAIWVLTSDPRIDEKDSGKLVEAARVLVARHGQSAFNHRVLGRALAHAGKPDQAIAEIQKAAEIARSNDAAAAPEGILSFALESLQADIEMIRAGKPFVENATPF
jgi:tetratricopeptide (TPR) repeat protein